MERSNTHHEQPARWQTALMDTSRGMPTFLVLTSPAAGNTDDDTTEQGLAVLRAAGEVRVVETGTPEQLDDALDGQAGSTLVVAGGDGSMHAVVDRLHARGELEGCTLGLLPLGTGNDFARGLGLPTDPAEAAEVIVAGHSRAVDVLLDEDGGPVVVNSVHAGAGADAARAGKSWKERWGRIGYAIGAVQAIVSPEHIHVRVEVDGRSVSAPGEHILQVAIGNGPYVGGGAPLTPDARPDDGDADVLIARTRGLGARLGYAAGLLIGRHGDRADVTTVRGRRVEVTGEDFWCSEDGELTGPHRRRVWSIAPAAYRIFVGEDPA